MLDVLNSLVDKANEKLKEEKYAKIRELQRKIVIKFEDDSAYYTILSDGKLEKFKETSKEDKGDIEVYLTTEIFKGILDGSVDALNAYLSRKIKIKAKLMDKVLFAEILK